MFTETSVIIPAYNRASVISRALNSVLNQTYQNFEVIIVDDASNDEIEKIIRGFSDNRIRYIKHEVNKGGAAARNTGILSTKNSVRYIAFLDSDDEWGINHLERKINILKRNQCYGVFGAYKVIKGDYVKKRNLSPKKDKISLAEYILSKHGDARTSTFVFDKQAIKKIMFDSTLLKNQDWDLMIRFSKVFDVCIDYQSTVFIYINATNRMSSFINHEAKREFLDKHSYLFSNKLLAEHYLKLAFKTLEFEGINDNYFYYINSVKINIANIEFSIDKLKLLIMLYVPVNKKRGIIKLINKSISFKQKIIVNTKKLLHC